MKSVIPTLIKSDTKKDFLLNAEIEQEYEMGNSFTIGEEDNDDDYVHFNVEKGIVKVQGSSFELTNDDYEILLNRAKPFDMEDADAEHYSEAGGKYCRIY